MLRIGRAASPPGDSGRRAASGWSTSMRWTVDGESRADLDGCADVEFESSAVTNLLIVDYPGIAARDV